MIVGTLKLLPAPNRRAEILSILRSVQGPVLAQPGCGAFQIFEEQAPERAIVLVERWESDEALDKHPRSENYRAHADREGHTPLIGAVDVHGHPGT